jgi:hypothetical protein
MKTSTVPVIVTTAEAHPQQPKHLSQLLLLFLVLLLLLLLLLQDEDLYSASNYALAAAMELHARVTNAFAANKSTAMLPPTFKYYDTSMPAPPANCSWRFDMGRQLWQAVWTANGTVRFELMDGNKYMLGIGEQLAFIAVLLINLVLIKHQDCQ